MPPCPFRNVSQRLWVKSYKEKGAGGYEQSGEPPKLPHRFSGEIMLQPNRGEKD